MHSSFHEELATLSEEYQRHLADYRLNLEQCWQELQNSPTSAKLKEISSIAHRLAGSGKAYGFDSLSHVAKGLEMACNSAATKPAPEFSHTLDQHVVDLLDCLRTNTSHAHGNESTPVSHHHQVSAGDDAATILIFDDDTDFCKMLSHLLRSTGYTVHGIDTLDAFVSCIERYRPGAVIVDMDFFGKRFAGANKVLEWRQRNGEPIPVIFVSGYDSFELRLAAVRAGGNFFLSKPLDEDRLLHLLDSELNLGPKNPCRVLLVDDDTDLLRLYKSTLTQAGFAVQTASGATSALFLLNQELPNLVLIDVHMPHCNGIELGQLIRQHEKFSHVPLLFMSAANDIDTQLACARLTSDEYVSKPIEPWRLVMLVKSRSSRQRSPGSVASSHSGIEQQRDPLTALHSLGSFRARVQSRLDSLQSHQTFAVLKLDVRDFHTVNNVYGRITGDQVLQRLAWELSQCLDDDGILGRESGDEFLIMTGTGATATSVTQLAESLAATTRKPMQFDDQRTIVLSSDIGIAMTTLDTKIADDLIRHADSALFVARRSGAPTVKYFDASLQDHQRDRFNLAQEVRHALQQNQFTAAYQAVFSFKDGSLIGFEALARWQHPSRGLIGPGAFMQVMEEQGFISELTLLMLETALKQLAHWRKTHSNLFMSINLSALDIQKPDFIDALKNLLDIYQLTPDSVVLEITETALLADWQTAIQTIDILRAMGVKLALDDFGTGYSSLSYLNRIRPSTLKIDKSFVSEWSESHDESLLRTMVHLGHDMDMNVVAEGIETVEELNFLKDINCNCYQGFLRARPMFKDDVALADWFSASKP
ncbi:EAL domain-containing protein [Pseudohongiella acticola]|jgi:diguanylate cyclase (GGDEF)-like protein|uniref:EAL domain-containing protein n=1 Tax=Pseudohongiella acticola TaxID=1524254 RepID=UPI0030EF2F41